jgi:hypothetical protein
LVWFNDATRNRGSEGERLSSDLSHARVQQQQYHIWVCFFTLPGKAPLRMWPTTRPKVAPASNVGTKRPAGASVPAVTAAKRKYGMKKRKRLPVLKVT